MSTRHLYAVAVGIGVATALAAARTAPQSAPRQADAPVTIDNDDIAGVVTGAKGPEAGVWVIAETSDLGTGFRKIVVTDDRGRFAVPDLPKATYRVWVRGYGLVDSPKSTSTPGHLLNLTAVAAQNARAAAEYYPASYWYSLLKIPAKSEFPGTGPAGNGISEGITSQGRWIEGIKTDSCESCHQLGDKATREIPKALGAFPNAVAAWDRRIQSGQDGGAMSNGLNTLGRTRALALFADWTDRIAHGAVPKAPPRPVGIERTVVITEWDWSGPKDYFHDVAATDRRHPTVNANGPLYGVHENSSDFLSIVDPVRHTAVEVPYPVKDPKTAYSTPRQVLQPSAYWGDEAIWNSQANVHSNVMDAKGRVWSASVIRTPETPAFCRAGSTHPSAVAFPLDRSGRQLSSYDPATKQFTLIDTCYGTHHLQFAEDANSTLWFCGGGDVVGWFNTKKFDETHDEQASQGWTALVMDTNGNGKRDAYVEPDAPLDPAKDRRFRAPLYAVIVSPADNTVWGTVTGFPGAIVHLMPGSNPPSTALAEYYQLPMKDGAPVAGFSPRGLDIDRNGIVWTVLSSGHLASFDRSKCRVTNGATATGQHCQDGWTFYDTPGPRLEGTASGSADSNYFNWVDQFDTLGLGRNTPIAIGNGSDALHVLDVKTGKFLTLRVPYPMGFFAKNIDGRLDDAGAGWKGRGVWSSYATRAPWHIEGGKGTLSKVVKFQIRPDPLAH